MLLHHLAIFLLFLTRGHARHQFYHFYNNQLLARQDNTYRIFPNHQHLLHVRRLGIRSPIPANKPASDSFPTLDPAAAAVKYPELQHLRITKQPLPPNPPKHDQVTTLEHAEKKSDVTPPDPLVRPKNPLAEQLLWAPDDAPPEPDAIAEKKCENRVCRVHSTTLFHADDLLGTEPAQPELVPPQSNADEKNQQKRKGPTASPKIAVPAAPPVPIKNQPELRPGVPTPQYQQRPRRGGDIIKPLPPQTRSRRLRLEEQRDKLYKKFTLAEGLLQQTRDKPGPLSPQERTFIKSFVDAKAEWNSVCRELDELLAPYRDSPGSVQTTLNESIKASAPIRNTATK